MLFLEGSSWALPVARLILILPVFENISRMHNIGYTRDCFLFCMSAIYLIAFSSLYVQIPGNEAMTLKLSDRFAPLAFRTLIISYNLLSFSNLTVPLYYVCSTFSFQLSHPASGQLIDKVFPESSRVEHLSFLSLYTSRPSFEYYGQVY